MSWVLCRKFVDVVDKFCVQIVKEADSANFTWNKSVNIGCSMSCFGWESEFEHIVLTYKQAFQYSTEIDGYSYEQIDEVDDLNSRFGLHEEPSIMPDLLNESMDFRGSCASCKHLIIKLSQSIKEVDH